jgi:hypothetical protein
MKAGAHLSDTDLVDLRDGCADPERRAHAEGCQACGARLEAFRQAWALVEADEAPEPSPLFWDHLSARVGQAVRTEAEVERRWPVWRVAFALVPVLVVVVAVGAVWYLGPAAGPAEFQATSTADAAGRGVGPAVTTVPEGDDAGDRADRSAAMAADDESWEVVAMLSESLGVDFNDVEGFEPTLGAADSALSELTAEEQQALARLLTEAMGGGPSQ